MFLIRNYFFSAMLAVSVSFAQIDTLVNEYHDLLFETSEEGDYSALYDYLEELSTNKIDINEADISGLILIPFLSAAEAELIIAHRNKYGKFYSSNELYSVKGLDPEVINKIFPFISVKIYDTQGNGSADHTYPYFKLRSRLIKDMQPVKGSLENHYAGSELKIYNKLSLNYEGFRLGVLTEKDAGEKLLNEFTSGYFLIPEYGFIKQAVLGDYTLEFGQGLIFSGPYGISKGQDPVNAGKKSRTLLPYSSTDENRFLRGGAVSLRLGDHTASTIFYSNNHFDAVIDSSGKYILSLPVDGMHRTFAEIKKRKSAYESIIGINSEYYSGNILIGGTYYYSKFNRILFNNSAESDKFQFLSGYFDLLLKKVNLFGELAYDMKYYSGICGAYFNISRSLQFTAAYRNYSPYYNNLHGNAFGENSYSINNERGYYTGIKWKTKKAVFDIYFDQFLFPEGNKNLNSIMEGSDLSLKTSVYFSSKITTIIRYKYQVKDLPVENLSKIIICKGKKQDIRSEINYNVNKDISVKQRIEFAYSDIKSKQISRGFLLMNEIRLRFFDITNISGRIIFYKTDSFESALYEYENDLTGIMYNSALFGEGIRWYLLVKYEPFSKCNLSLKYSESIKPKERYLGSGYDQIEGNLDNRLSLQIDLQL